MSTLRVLLVLGTLLNARRFDAAVSYTVTVTDEPETTTLSKTRQFSVLADTGRIRAKKLPSEETSLVVYDDILWTKGSPTVALNSRNQTWFELRGSPFALSSRFLTPLFDGTANNAVLRLDDLGRTAGGEHQYTGQVTYDVYAEIGGERVKVTCVAAFAATTTENIDRAYWRGRYAAAHGLRGGRREILRG
ncbi:MAG TPA: hypothetical protein VGS96_13720 [Thermoanaerobaculia bacterium]|jgi:hypothetical protein|nr:hypothetical protein [Thermoanaerobaculia bacterium]